MEILFSTKKLNKKLNSQKELRKEFPAKVADTIARRLIELRAADHLGQISHLPPMKLHMLTGDRKNQFAVSAKEKFRICFYAMDDEGNRIVDSNWPRERIKIIQIIKVEDYHG